MRGQKPRYFSYKIFFSTKKLPKLLNMMLSSTFRSSHRKCSVIKVFLEISQNLQENTIKKGTLAQVFSCEFCEISKNTFSYRTPPVASSVCVTFLWAPGTKGLNVHPS